MFNGGIMSVTKQLNNGYVMKIINDSGNNAYSLFTMKKKVSKRSS